MQHLKVKSQSRNKDHFFVAIINDLVYQTVLFIDPPTPITGKLMFELLRISRSRRWVYF
jgi:hypothetical protein